ncbi:MAG: protease [Phycisphaerales bacterium]|jgi:protease-4|nr:protease [Phycisphaerales bacterium]
MRAHLFLVALLATVLTSLTPIRAAEAPKEEPTKPTVAIFELDGPVLESSTQDLALFGEKPVALRELVKRLRASADDANVKAVVLIAENLELGPAQTEEIRGAIKHVRDKGKDVFVHSDSMQMKEYLVFAGASKISMSPTSDLWVLGLHAEAPYVRGLLDKIGVKPDFLHMGAYKSAAEMFTRTGPSPEAEEMFNWLLDSLHASAIDMIASARKVEPAKVKGWIDEGLFTAEHAKEAGLIDVVEHRQDFDAALKKKFGDSLVYDRRYGQEREKQIDFSNPFAMFQILGEMFGGPKQEGPKKDAVGIVYVDGIILPGNSRPSIFGSGNAAHSSDIRKALDKVARDDSIKAVVLRVDSPGGSAVASEIILDATRRLKSKKPFVVSMGNVAGSGGYYVSLGSDTIFADQTTITASIGVVGGKFVTTDMWKKIGIQFKVYERGQSAGILASDEPFTDAERKKVESWMDDVYGVFKKHVTDSRGKRLKKPIDELAGGRVFTGRQALELGLIDKIGTLQDAIAFVAKEAKLPDDHDIRVVPQPKNFIEQLMDQSKGGGEDENRWVAAPALPPASAGMSLIDLAAPYLQHLDPHRTAAIKSALNQLQLLDRESVILTMPEILLLDSR